MGCGCGGARRAAVQSVEQAAAEAQVRADEARAARGDTDTKSAKNALTNASSGANSAR